MFNVDPDTLKFIGFCVLVYGSVGLLIYLNHRMGKRRMKKSLWDRILEAIGL